MNKKRKRDAMSEANIGPNASSPAGPSKVRPLTPEEMAAAKPIPLPTVTPSANASPAGVPYVGKGETNPPGRPEVDKASPKGDA